jgi:hypothetical protein
MTAPATKTKALSIATPCTSVDQFVATFHRFCGDDQTFFVATMTSRPVGLETAFSIQLADKQPVLRGLCVVLDAWTTPDNRYKRPGIRLGIKRLTSDSQIVFDRLRAASKAPAVSQSAETAIPGVSLPAAPPSATRSALSPPAPPVGTPLAPLSAMPPPAPPVGTPLAPLSALPPPAPPVRPPVLPPPAAPPPTAPPPVPPLSALSRPAPLPPSAPRSPAGPAPSTEPPPLVGAPAPALPGSLGWTPSGALPRPSAFPLRAIATPPPLPSLPRVRPVDRSPELEPRSRPIEPSGAPDPAERRAAVPSALETAATQPSSAAPGDPALRAIESQASEPMGQRGAVPSLLETAVTQPSSAAPPGALVVPPEPAIAPGSFAPDALAAPGAAASDSAASDSAHVGRGSELAARRPPAPIEVTRFQVALSVGTVPPPVSEVEFRPQQLAPRQRFEPRIESASDDAPVDPDDPAEIVDRATGDRPRVDPPGASRHDTLPSFAPVGLAASGAAPGSAAEIRTPGSALILPANPLHNLSDESLEGFVDCTVYEETDNVFHPGQDDREWRDMLGSPARDPASPAPPPAPSVPAMPFDTAPVVTVRSLGDTESLAVVPDVNGRASGTIDGAAAPAVGARSAPSGQLFTGAMAVGAPDEVARAAQAVWLDPPAPPDAAALSAAGYPVPHAGVTFRSGTSPGFGPDPGPGAGPASGSDIAPDRGPARAAELSPDPMYARFLPVSLGAPAPGPPPVALDWRRWLLITGSAVVAIVIAFAIARQIRGPDRRDPAATPRAAGVRATAPPTAAPRDRPGGSAGEPKGAPAPRSRTAAPGSGSAERSARPVAAVAAVAEPASDATPDATAPGPDDDGDAATAGAPVVGSGPCRIEVATTPAGSVVRFDDQALGASPLVIEASCDKHRIDVSHVRYQNVTRLVALAAEKPQQIDIALPRPIHAVSVSSSPPGAELSIDGHRAGTTPTVVQMMGFATVKLTFTKSGFQSVTKKVYSKQAQDRVFVKLTK